MRKAWVSGVACFALLAAVYAYGFELRRAEGARWLASGYAVDGEMMLPTNDAYFELVMADGGRSREAPSVLSGMVALGGGVTGRPLGDVGFLLPLLLAPLAALPPMWLLWRYGYHAGALAAGVFAASCPSYLGRTRLGCLDTDVLSLFFPLLLASCLAWFTGPVNAGNETGDRAWRNRLTRRHLPAAAIGLTAWAYLAFYPSGKVIAAALIVSAVPVACLTQRRRLVPAALELGLIALTAYRPVLGLAGVFALAALARVPGIRRRMAAVPAFLFPVCLLPPAAYFLHRDFQGLIGTVTRYIASYMVKDPPMGEGAVTFGLNIPNSYALIAEVKPVRPEALSAMITPEYAALLLSLAGIVIMLKKRPQLFVFLPLAGLGAASLFLGVRFTMYGAALGVFFGVAVSLFQPGGAGAVRSGPSWWRRIAGNRRWRLAGHGLSWGLCLALCWLLAAPTLGTMRAVQPVAFFSPAFGRALKTLDRHLPPGCVLWLWWDYGFTAQYLARRDTVADSHRNDFTSIYLPGLAMTTASPAQGSRIMRFVGNMATPVKHIEGTKHVVYTSAAMGRLIDMGHEKAVALLESFKSSPLPSRPGAPEQYAVVSWEGLGHLYHMSAVGLWDLRRGGSHKYKLMRLNKENMARLEDGRIMTGENVLASLGGASVFHADGTVEHMDFHNGSKVFAIWRPAAGEGFLLHEDMYNSVFVRLLRWQKSNPPIPGFALAVDRGPLMRVFKSVESGAE